MRHSPPVNDVVPNQRRIQRPPARADILGKAPYSLLFPAAFTLAHRALAAIERAFLTAALTLRLGLASDSAATVNPFAALYFAHLALAPAIKAARPAALILRFLAGLDS